MFLYRCFFPLPYRFSFTICPFLLGSQIEGLELKTSREEKNESSEPPSVPRFANPKHVLIFLMYSLSVSISCSLFEVLPVGHQRGREGSRDGGAIIDHGQTSAEDQLGQTLPKNGR